MGEQAWRTLLAARFAPPFAVMSARSLTTIGHVENLPVSKKWKLHSTNDKPAGAAPAVPAARRAPAAARQPALLTRSQLRLRRRRHRPTACRAWPWAVILPMECACVCSWQADQHQPACRPCRIRATWIDPSRARPVRHHAQHTAAYVATPLCSICHVADSSAEHPVICHRIVHAMGTATSQSSPG